MWKHIETYIQQNRAALDVEEPKPEIWAGIEARLGPALPVPARPRPLFQLWKVAAAILVGTAIGLGLLYFGPQEPARQMGAAGLQEVPMAAETWADTQETHLKRLTRLEARMASQPPLPAAEAAAFAAEQAELAEALALIEARITQAGPQRSLVEQWVRTQSARAELLERYTRTLSLP